MSYTPQDPNGVNVKKFTNIANVTGLSGASQVTTLTGSEKYNYLIVRFSNTSGNGSLSNIRLKQTQNSGITNPALTGYVVCNGQFTNGVYINNPVGLDVNGTSSFTSAQITIIVYPIGHIDSSTLRLECDLNSCQATLNVTACNNIGSIIPFITNINGQTAHSFPATGNPLRIGAKVKTSNDTSLIDGDSSDIACTTDQAMINKLFAVPELDWTFSCAAAISLNTDVVIKSSAGTGLKNYITGFQIINSSATIATEVVIKDGSTVIWRGYVGIGTVLNAAVGISMLTPLRGTAATALNFACITTGSAVYVNAQGYIAP